MFTESSFCCSCVNIGNVLFATVEGMILNRKIISLWFRVCAFPYCFMFSVVGLSY
jgi:hypothetical protein